MMIAKRSSTSRSLVLDVLLLSIGGCSSTQPAHGATVAPSITDASREPMQTAPGGGSTPLQPLAAGRSGAAGVAAGKGGAGALAVGAGAAMAGNASTAGTSASTLGASGGVGIGPAAGSGVGGSAGTMAGAAGAASVACPASGLAPGEATTNVQVGGAARSFILHVPKGYTGKTPAPLVIDWHSLGSTGSGQEGISGYKALSDEEGFLIAWPNGIDYAWNIGPCCTTSRTVDDLGFAKAIVENVKSRACIDSQRVYADGYSMGGGMSHYLACNAADVFAAVAPSAFDLLTEDEEPCHPTRPISVIFFRGTSDPLVPYGGGASMPPSGLDVTIHFLGAEGTFKKWSELDGCADMPIDSGDGCQSYTQCKDGVEVTLCTKQGGGHDPGDATRGWTTLKKYSLP